MYTYFIADTLHVKIGKSINPQLRLSELQVSHPTQLKILLLLPEDREKDLHQLFAKYRVRGEWFTLSYSIQKFISENSQIPLRVSFYTWLLDQCDRQDEIGRFALIATTTRTFPKNIKQLKALRRHYSGDHLLMPILSLAHGEWCAECTNNDGSYIRQIKRKSLRDTKHLGPGL